MKGTCEVDYHPRGTKLGAVVKEGPKARYHNVICPRCGRVQGVRRVIKQDEQYAALASSETAEDRVITRWVRRSGWAEEEL